MRRKTLSVQVDDSDFRRYERAAERCHCTSMSQFIQLALEHMASHRYSARIRAIRQALRDRKRAQAEASICPHRLRGQEALDAGGGDEIATETAEPADTSTPEAAAAAHPPRGAEAAAETGESDLAQAAPADSSRRKDVSEEP